MPALLDTGFLAEGNLNFGLLAADGVTPIGYYTSKNSTTFQYNPGSPTIKQRLSKKINQYGRILDQVAIPKPSELTLGFDTVDADGLATIFRGSTAALTATGAVVAATAFAVTALGVYLPLPQRYLSAVTVTNTAGTTTYVEGVDYDIDYSRGWIICYASPGAITLGNIKVGYTYATYAGTRITGEVTTQLNMQISFDGKNLADGRYITVTVPKAVMAPSKAIDLMSEDFAVAELTGSPVQVGNSAPISADYITTVPAGF